MIVNLQAGMMQAPEFEAATAQNPEVQSLMGNFLAGRQARTLETATAKLPGLIEDSARAFARRFTVRELRDIRQFFETRSGQTYLREATTIMADPDIAAWQRNVMVQSMQNIQADIQIVAASLPSAADNSTSPQAPADRTNVTGTNLDAMRGGTTDDETETGE